MRRENKKWGDEMRDKKNGETRCQTKKWGDETQDKKIGRHDAKLKKGGDMMRDKKKMGRQGARQKENGKTRPV